MKFDPATNIFDLKSFGEFGGVNPSIADSATFTFMKAETMIDTFNGESKGCFLYSRHWNPSTKYLADAIAAMERTESAWVTASGMSAITSTILQICKTGDHIIACRTIYGGSYAFMKNYLPKFNIDVTFVDITNLEEVEKSIKANTKIIYTETMNNPLLEISDIKSLSAISKKNDLKLVVDNTFTPMIFTPSKLGADVVIYSITKFLNGSNDTVGGAICGTEDFINSLIDVNSGSAMLLGPVMDSLRAANTLKNMHHLHVRMKQHSLNAMYLAKRLKEIGIKVKYPGMEEHPQHNLMKQTMNTEFGFGGMIVMDVNNFDNASNLMKEMQDEGVGYLAVSLGYFKTLFSNPGSSTSSEVTEKDQEEMGMTSGLIRFSVGLDNDIEDTFNRIEKCLKKLKLV